MWPIAVYSISPSSPIEPTTTSPELIPIRTARSMPSLLISAASSATPAIISSAARQAHCAWSSRAIGAPNSAMMPSPVNLSTVPSARCTASASTWKNRFISSRHDSGSSRSARSIDPRMSANRTLICLRSPSSDARPASIFQVRSSGTARVVWASARSGSSRGPTGVPHWLQNLEPAGTSAPQLAQVVWTTRRSPHWPQKRESAGFSWPHSRQGVPGSPVMGRCYDGAAGIAAVLAGPQRREPRTGRTGRQRGGAAFAGSSALSTRRAAMGSAASAR